MRRLFFAVGLMLAYCGIARADAYGTPQAQYTYQTAVSSNPLAIINVSTSSITGATQMDNPQLLSRAAMCIQDIDSSANLWCTPVSTTPVVNGGWKISAGSFWCPNSAATFYQVLYSTTTNNNTVTTVANKYWCISDGTSTTKAAVIQGN